MRHRFLISVTVVMMLSFWGPGAGATWAQVLIDMPPAKSKPSSSSSPSASQSGAAQPLLVTAVAPISATLPATSASAPDVGDVALARYSRARRGPADVYDNNPRYAGIRYYSYPYSYGYPFWFWWGGFHGHGHGNHCH